MGFENNVGYDVPDFVREAEEAMARGETFEANTAEVTIKFGKGLVGEPFTSKNGKELVEVLIPNPDKVDDRPWESFVISPKMIHDNKFGKGVWMKLPENGTTRLSRSVKTGVDDRGGNIWQHVMKHRPQRPKLITNTMKQPQSLRKKRERTLSFGHSSIMIMKIRLFHHRNRLSERKSLTVENEQDENRAHSLGMPTIRAKSRSRLRS